MTGASDGNYAKLSLTTTADNSGYLYVYVVNESQQMTHFDDLAISISALNVLSTRDYYPYGSVAKEWVNEDFDDRYRFQYQGQFAEMDTVTGWNHFELREWDGRIARWMATDPYGQFASPYNGMGNNPMSGVDPDGGWFGIGKNGGSGSRIRMV